MGRDADAVIGYIGRREVAHALLLCATLPVRSDNEQCDDSNDEGEYACAGVSKGRDDTAEDDLPRMTKTINKVRMVGCRPLPP